MKALAYVCLALCVGIITIVASIAARGENTCPPWKPIERQVVDATSVTCTLALTSQLTCPTDPKEPCLRAIVQSACPGPPTRRECFTAKEIEQATKPQTPGENR